MKLAVDTVYTSDDATDASRQILSLQKLSRVMHQRD